MLAQSRRTSSTPTRVMALPVDVKITARSLKPAALFFLFPFARLIWAVAELWPQPGLRNKTTCAAFEIPGREGRRGKVA